MAGGLADDRPGVLGGGPLGSKADLASGLAKGLAMPEKFASLAEMEDWIEMIKARVIGGGDIRISGGGSGNTDTLV